MSDHAHEMKSPGKQEQESTASIMSHGEKMRAWWKLYNDAAAIEKKLIASGKLHAA